MTAVPRISVVMPVYNTGPFVAASVRSILAQTFTDFEFIIIDDGSTDDSLAVLKPLADADARIRLVSRPNAGYGVTLTEGMSLARASYLARLDSDDLSEPERLRMQYEALEADPQLVAIGSCGIAIDEHDQVIGNYDVPLTHEAIEEQHLRGSSSIHHPAVLMRAQAFAKVGGYRMELVPCEDFDLWLRLGEVGRLANLPQRLLKKRMLTNGLVVSNARKHETALRKVMDDAWSRRGLPGRYEPQASSLRRPADFYRQWGWMALKRGDARGSRRFAWRAVQAQPLAWESWKLLACTVRGH
jgi:glycosyltransferase involved in cell wall biosynthesis